MQGSSYCCLIKYPDIVNTSILLVLEKLRKEDHELYLVQAWQVWGQFPERLRPTKGSLVGLWVHSFNTRTRVPEAAGTLWFEASLVYNASPKKVRTKQRNPVSKKHKKVIKKLCCEKNVCQQLEEDIKSLCTNQTVNVYWAILISTDVCKDVFVQSNSN